MVFWLCAMLAQPVFSFEHLTIEDGLTQTTVREVLQDGDGFIWIATGDGISRYDGLRLRNYRHRDAAPDSLSDNAVWTMARDRAGGIWVATRDGMLNRYDPLRDGFVRYAIPSEQARVTAMLADADGGLWIGLELRPLLRFDLARHTFQSRFPEVPGPSSVTAMALDRTGELWLASGASLMRYRDAAFHAIALPAAYADATITALSWRDDSHLLLGFGDGRALEYARNPARFSAWQSATLQARPGAAVTRFWEDRHGCVWTAMYNAGLYQFCQGKRVHFYQHEPTQPDSLSHNNVTSLFEDASGVLWVGTGSGLNKLDPRKRAFEHWRAIPGRPGAGLASDLVDAIAESADALWIGTQGGLTRLDKRSGEFRQFYGRSARGPLMSSHITTLLAEGGSLWVGSLLGLERLELGSLVSHPIPITRGGKALAESKVSSLARTADGRLLIGTFDDGLYELAPGAETALRGDMGARVGAVDIYSLYTVGPDVFVLTIDGVYWFGPNAELKQRFFAGTPARERLSGKAVTAMLRDETGTLWFGTDNGLNRYDPAQQRFTVFGEPQGLANGYINAVLSDAAGGIWVSTNKGISRLSRDGRSLRNFRAEDGIGNTEFIAGAGFRDEKGRLYFGGISGLTVFSPSEVHSDPAPPAVVLTELLLFNQPVRPGDGSGLLSGILGHSPGLSFDYRQSVFTLEFAALNYSSPRQNRYAYKLEGFDRDWILTGADNPRATYTGLPDGNYRFRVRAANPDGVWNETGVSLPIRVLPPPWRTWWAYSLYALALFGLIAWYLRLHRKELAAERAVASELRRLDQQKDEFLANTSHELRTPLNGIIGIAESLLAGAEGALAGGTRRQLNLIATSGRRLAHLVNDILDYKRLSRRELVLVRAAVDVRDTVDAVLALCQPMIAGKTLALVNAVPADTGPVDADANRLQQILYNLVGNAIKFTDAGTVTVRAQTSDEGLAIEVSDTGCGIPDTEFEHIFESFEQLANPETRRYGGSGLGLSITRLLVELHGGQIGVRSSLGEGSVFRFTLPLARAGQDRAPLALPALSPVGMAEPGRPAGAAVIDPEAVSILVVDDDPTNLQVLVNFLELRGYRVTALTDPRQALELVENGALFALAVLDVMMPNLSGYELCRALRQRYSALELPILFLSAKTRSEDIVAGLEAGGNDYIGKPVDSHELLARVGTLLRLHEVSAARRERDEALSLATTTRRLTRYFPQPLVERILADSRDPELKVERRRITVLFSDLAGFTELTDRLEPEEIAQLLNHYLADMAALIAEHGGVLNEVMGDGLLVFFGTPGEMAKQEQAWRAVHLAVAMQQALGRLSAHWFEEGLEHRVALRIGIHQGYATVGNFGSAELMAYRALGSAVNLASRLEQSCPPGSIKVSHRVYALTRAEFPYAEPVEELFKGFAHGHRVALLDPARVRLARKLVFLPGRQRRGA